MKKILASLFGAALARLRGMSPPHNDNLRAGQFGDRAPFGVYRALFGG